MKEDKQTTERLIRTLAAREHNVKFVISSLRILSSLEMKKDFLEWLNENPKALKKDIENKLFNMVVEEQESKRNNK
jgi:hypothetical protein